MQPVAAGEWFAAFERTLDRLLVGNDLERSRRDVEREFLVE